MSARNILQSAAGASGKTYVDDVFSAYTYTGNGSTQTITNGIDLAGKGGLVWLKDRTSANPAWIMDTVRGTASTLQPSSTNGAGSISTAITAFNTNGFTIGSNGNSNTSNNNYVAWTFRKAPKFFDIVTYTGNGANRTIAHSLGQVPGMIAVKRTDTAGAWMVYHNSISNTENLVLNASAAKATGTARWNSTTATASVFSLGTDASVNANTGTYVAYLFAHDASADGLIQCGSFTTDGNGNATVPLGWEPQFLIIKGTSVAESWRMLDQMCGVSVGGKDAMLYCDDSAAETNSIDTWNPTATGFTIPQYSVSTTYIYMAIRRPNKPPTSGTQVYNAIARTGTGAAATVTGVGFAPDLVHAFARTAGKNHMMFDRLRGATIRLYSNTTDAEAADAPSLTGFDVMDGVSLGVDGTYSGINFNGRTYINHFFKRAPGVFDVVCYTGNSSTVPGGDVSISHGLGVAPELAIVKIRDIAGDWAVGHSSDWTKTLVLDSTSAGFTGANNQAFTAPTASVLNVRNNNVSSLNANAHTYVTYLFATLAGVSKVGSYTGNGSSQTINCGFSAGARFVLIKRTDSTGDWFVWDTARGIVSANDPHLSLNTTAAEVTTDDSIDPDTSGFIVNQVAATNINVTSATYIYLAIA